MDDSVLHIRSRANSIEELHDDLKASLGFPEFYGANLAALWDCLTGMISPCTIEWHDYDDLRKLIGSELDLVRQLFEEAAESCSDLRVRFV